LSCVRYVFRMSQLKSKLTVDSQVQVTVNSKLVVNSDRWRLLDAFNFLQRGLILLVNGAQLQYFSFQFGKSKLIIQIFRRTSYILPNKKSNFLLFLFLFSGSDIIHISCNNLRSWVQSSDNLKSNLNNKCFVSHPHLTSSWTHHITMLNLSHSRAGNCDLRQKAVWQIIWGFQIFIPLVRN